jgi:hypothetical protein
MHALTSFGFTARQASFLVLVMLHAGVCLGRQYCEPMPSGASPRCATGSRSSA